MKIPSAKEMKRISEHNQGMELDIVLTEIIQSIKGAAAIGKTSTKIPYYKPEIDNEVVEKLGDYGYSILYNPCADEREVCWG